MTESTVGAIEKSELVASSNAKVPLKNRYKTPRLCVYGDLATITKTVGMGTQFDGMNNKTH